MTYQPTNPEEEQLILEEEFTTCPAHPAQMVEYFTDCPRCMEDDFMRQEAAGFPEDDPFCLPATSDGSVDETRWV